MTFSVPCGCGFPKKQDGDWEVFQNLLYL